MRVVLDSGEVIDLGTTETAPTIGIVDYSRRVTDDFGVTTVVQRGFARRMSVRVAVPFDAVDTIQRRLAELRATSARWIADDRFASLSIEGFYKEFSLDVAMPPISYCTLSVEGLSGTDGVADAGGDPAPVGQPSTLQLLQPVDLTTAQLSASTVPESDAPEWSATTPYPTGARVIKAATHRVYEAIAAASIGDDPAGVSGKWLDIGPTNRWAMFDQALGSATSAPGEITVTLDAGAVRAVALLDVIGLTVRVKATGYDRTVFAASGTIPFLDLPANAGRVTITVRGDGTVSVGTLLVGRLVALGITEASPTAGITDYSRKVVDDFGEVTIVQRAWAKRMTANALIRTDAVDVVANQIAAVRAQPCLWIGQAGMDSLSVYGFFKEFSVEVGESVSKLSLSIEGMSTAGKVAPLGAAVNWPDIADPQGTKPADNADKTSENTSKDTDAVGGRPSPDLLSDVRINQLSILSQALRQDDLAAVTDRRTFVEGQPVSTYVLTFRQDQKGENSAINSKLDLLGAKTNDGTGWVLNLDTVQIGGGKTLAQRFTEIGASSDRLNVSVEQLMEAVINPDGSGYGKFVLRANANKTIVGIAGTADGDVGRLSFAADQFDFVDPNGGSAINILTYRDDRWTLSADLYAQKIVADVIETKHIKSGQITSASFMSFPDQAVGAGEVTLAEASLTVGDEIDGQAVVWVSFTQDSSQREDTAMMVRAYVDVGQGYLMVRGAPQGVVVSGAKGYWILPVSFAVPVLGNGPVRVKVTAQGYGGLAGSYTSGSYARYIQIIVFAGAR